MDLSRGKGRSRAAGPAVDTPLARLAVLGDPVRRALYLAVVSRPSGVSRDQAARVAGVSRPLAAFHLDKLVGAGLLEASFRRLGRRRGRGAGRPAKLYRRSDIQVDVSLPPRDYELAARVFAYALAARPGPSRARLHRAARRFGAALGREARGGGGRPARGAALRQLSRLLRRLGYEPFQVPGGTWRLHNCPFDTLAREYRTLTCGMNQQLLAGVVHGLGLARCRAALDPQPGTCCVALRLKAPRRPPSAMSAKARLRAGG